MNETGRKLYHLQMNETGRKLYHLPTGEQNRKKTQSYVYRRKNTYYTRRTQTKYFSGKDPFTHNYCIQKNIRKYFIYVYF
jgi:hypothetical protein